jgi:hypothetical protein
MCFVFGAHLSSGKVVFILGGMRYFGENNFMLIGCLIPLARMSLSARRVVSHLGGLYFYNWAKFSLRLIVIFYGRGCFLLG